MIRTRLKGILTECFKAGVTRHGWPEEAAGAFTVEQPKREGQGDLATNLALVVAGRARQNPRVVAGQLVELLCDCPLLDRMEIAGPGFVNFFIRPQVWQETLSEIAAQDATFGKSQAGAGKRVLVEFVSANPTGPLSVGHGRQAVLGDAICRLLTATGHQVTREYYYNDAGRQMRVLAQSVRARYLELLGEPGQFPEDGYQGQYIIDIARELLAEEGERLRGADDLAPFKAKAERAIFADINATLTRLGIHFDNYYNEHSLYDEGHIDEVVAELRAKGLVYEQEGAVWFKTTALGLDQDRVIIKSTGEPTYRLPDIAYHREKFKRGFDWMVNIFGSDHIATVPDVLAGVRALGYDDSRVTVVLHQFVTLLRDGKQVKMSTRKATFVTVDELLAEVGADVARFFFLMRKADSQLEFDLTLATQQSQENPVYYVQYGHARLCSILRQADEKGLVKGESDQARLALLTEPEELGLLKAISTYPELVLDAARELAPHRVVFYLQELAGQFHSYYNRHRVLGEDAALSQARLALVDGLRIVLRNGLNLIGVSAPESM
ncbi:MAG: arginine--tRNA ligase [Desulfobacteraceae bacterium]|nr:arginine--tRNA ligase [Desulfobacteraceae bacterium]